MEEEKIDLSGRILKLKIWIDFSDYASYYSPESNMEIMDSNIIMDKEYIGNDLIPGHSDILSTDRSKYFKTLLAVRKGNLKEKAVYLIDDCSYDVFKFIRDWIYSDIYVIYVFEDDEPLLFLEQVYRAATRFDLVPLTRIIRRYLMHIVDIYNVGTLYAVSKRLGLVGLEALVLRTWARNAVSWNVNSGQVDMIFPGGSAADTRRIIDEAFARTGRYS